MRVVHAGGLAGAATAGGTVVVIDVLRAFTVSAYALAGGARECRLVPTLEEARNLQKELPGSVVSAEVDGLPVEGIEISNSPTQIVERDLSGRTLIQRTSSGTQGVAAAAGASAVFAGSLVVSRATARALGRLQPELVTLVAMGEELGHPEDLACALYLEGLLAGIEPKLEPLLAPLRTSDRYRLIRSGGVPGFPPSDLTLALLADRFDFAMPVEHGRLSLLRPDLPGW